MSDQPEPAFILEIPPIGEFELTAVVVVRQKGKLPRFFVTDTAGKLTGDDCYRYRLNERSE